MNMGAMSAARGAEDTLTRIRIFKRSTKRIRWMVTARTTSKLLPTPLEPLPRHGDRYQCCVLCNPIAKAARYQAGGLLGFRRREASVRPPNVATTPPFRTKPAHSKIKVAKAVERHDGGLEDYEEKTERAHDGECGG